MPVPHWPRRDTIVYTTGGSSPVAPIEQVCVLKNCAGRIKGGSIPHLLTSPSLPIFSCFENLSQHMEYHQT